MPTVHNSHLFKHPKAPISQVDLASDFNCTSFVVFWFYLNVYKRFNIPFQNCTIQLPIEGWWGAVSTKGISGTGAPLPKSCNTCTWWCGRNCSPGWRKSRDRLETILKSETEFLLLNLGRANEWKIRHFIFTAFCHAIINFLPLTY